MRNVPKTFGNNLSRSHQGFTHPWLNNIRELKLQICLTGLSLRALTVAQHHDQSVMHVTLAVLSQTIGVAAEKNTKVPEKKKKCKKHSFGAGLFTPRFTPLRDVCASLPWQTSRRWEKWEGLVYMLRHQLVPLLQSSPSNKAMDKKVLRLIKNVEKMFFF